MLLDLTLYSQSFSNSFTVYSVYIYSFHSSSDFASFLSSFLSSAFDPGPKADCNNLRAVCTKCQQNSSASTAPNQCCTGSGQASLSSRCFHFDSHLVLSLTCIVLYHFVSCPIIAYHFWSFWSFPLIYSSRTKGFRLALAGRWSSAQSNCRLGSGCKVGSYLFRKYVCVLLTKMWMTAPSQSDLPGQCLQKLLQMCGAAADSFKAVQKTAALFAFDGLVQLPCKSIPFHPLDTATYLFVPFPFCFCSLVSTVFLSSRSHSPTFRGL